MDYIYSIDKWVTLPEIKYNDYLLIQLNDSSNFVIFSDELNSIIYRDGYFESGGNFLVYQMYNGVWKLIKDGFGSPTNICLYIGTIDNISKASSHHNIIDFNSSEVVIFK